MGFAKFVFCLFLASISAHVLGSIIGNILHLTEVVTVALSLGMTGILWLLILISDEIALALKEIVTAIKGKKS